MKLVWKLTAALLAAMCSVLAIQSYIRVRNDIELIESDMKINHHAMGRALAAVIAEVWRDQGEALALELLETANQQEKQVLIRWVWLDGAIGRDDR